jgi:hypothetical protein
MSGLWGRIVGHAHRSGAALVLCLALSLAACAGSPAATNTASNTPIGTPASTSTGTPSALPSFDHIVVVVEENHSYGDIIGSADAPYINALASKSALFTASHAVTHPSQPNYLALFAGSTFVLSSDDCPQHFNAPNLGGELLAAGKSFVGYSESLPSAGFTGCNSDDSAHNYARKHNPWSDFSDVASAASNQPFSAFPSDFTSLPAVAFVVPNQVDDMHSGSISAADDWLQANMDSYIQWAQTHNSLLILTWDEDDSSSANHILTLFAGAHVHNGQYAEAITHYDVLRTIETLEGIPATGKAATAHAIADVWQP